MNKPEGQLANDALPKQSPIMMVISIVIGLFGLFLILFGLYSIVTGGYSSPEDIPITEIQAESTK